jgi:hypothetical protein
MIMDGSQAHFPERHIGFDFVSILNDVRPIKPRSGIRLISFTAAA